MADPAAGAARPASLVDPARYRIVQFDQRGCGRSLPHAGDWSTDLSTNTTHRLIRDIEALRNTSASGAGSSGAHVGVSLALAYAERYPARVPP